VSRRTELALLSVGRAEGSSFVPTILKKNSVRSSSSPRRSARRVAGRRRAGPIVWHNWAPSPPFFGRTVLARRRRRSGRGENHCPSSARTSAVCAVPGCLLGNSKLMALASLRLPQPCGRNSTAAFFSGSPSDTITARGCQAILGPPGLLNLRSSRRKEAHSHLHNK